MESKPGVFWCRLKATNLFRMSGERGRNRTYNLLIKSQLLCQLSYAPALMATSCAAWLVGRRHGGPQRV